MWYDSLLKTCDLCVVQEPRSSTALLLSIDFYSQGLSIPTTRPFQVATGG